MRRREFTSLLCSAAVSWPLAARAQQSPLPVVGFLNGASPVPFAYFVAAFRRGLHEMGYVEGRVLTTGRGISPVLGLQFSPLWRGW